MALQAFNDISNELTGFWSNLVSKPSSVLPATQKMTFAGSQMTSQSALKMHDWESNAPSCSNPQISCRNISVVEDLCCFNAPGGQMLQTQFWDVNPPTGPADSWYDR